jgi:hypothetical protein
VTLGRGRVVRDLDSQRLVLDLSTVSKRDDGRRLPRDLLFVERGELARALRLGLPVEQQARRALVFRSVGRTAKCLERQRQRVGPENRRVSRIDRLQLGGRLLAGVREIIFARDLLHERFAVGAKPFDRQRCPGRCHVAIRA